MMDNFCIQILCRDRINYSVYPYKRTYMYKLKKYVCKSTIKFVTMELEYQNLQMSLTIIKYL